MEIPQTYQLVAEQSYDTLPGEVKHQVQLNPQIMEVKFVRVAGKEQMYDTYVANRNPSSLLKDFQFVAEARTGDLTDLLQREFSDRERLPSNVRVIRTSMGRDLWRVYLRRY